MRKPVPFEQLSLLARHEAHRKSLHRPPYYLHKWWARRTGSVVRGMLLDLLLPAEADRLKAFYLSHDFSAITILDPFMGGGATLGEALRLGCRAVGCDVNPVSWFLVKRSLETIELAALDEAFATVEAAVSREINSLYAATCVNCEGPATIQNACWVKQIECAACAAPVDLNLDQVVMRSFSAKTKSLVDCPACGHLFRTSRLDTRQPCPSCRHRFTPRQRRCRNTDYRCSCGHQQAILGSSGRLGHPLPHRLRALTVWCERCGRVRQAPTSADVAGFEAIEARVRDGFRGLMIPRQRIPSGSNTDQLRRYGYKYWHQLFNARQLAALDILFRAIARIEQPAARETLLLLASASLEFNSMLCSPKGIGTGAIRQVFTHHAFIPAKTALEANVWGSNGSSGGFATLYRNRIGPAVAWAASPSELRLHPKRRPERVPVRGEKLAGVLASSFDELTVGDANLLVLNQSSEQLDQIPDASIDLVVTDPPYADMVMYSELSDFFYVWLRMLLKETYPASFAAPLVDDSREAVHNDGRQRDACFYGTLLGSVLREAVRTLKPGGRVAFSFHHAGERGWNAIEVALIDAGLCVERWWPVFAEMESGVPLRGKDNGGHLDIVFVCGLRREVTMLPSEPAAALGARLARHLTLVPADYRALLRAAEVQRNTWSASEGATPATPVTPVTRVHS